MVSLALSFVLALSFQPVDPAASFRLVRAQSGPSGKVVGAKLVLDETRNRFVYPKDKSLMAYFEWAGPQGDHTITGIWKSPDGQIYSTSSDIRLQVQTPEFGAYWQFALSPGMPSGKWTLEAQIDGKPAGSCALELEFPAPAKSVAAEPTPTAAPEGEISLDELYQTTKPSMVWVHRRDSSGRRVDTSTGFIIGQNRVATAFQGIDGGASVEVQFDDGQVVATNETWGINRLEDWAILKVPTGSRPALRRSEHPKVPIGAMLHIYNATTDRSRVLGKVQVGGRRTQAGFAEYLQFTSTVSKESAGGPLLDSQGFVVGLIGGGMNMGARIARKAINISSALFSALNTVNAAVYISQVVEMNPPNLLTLGELARREVLTPEVTPSTPVSYGGTTRAAVAPTSTMLPPDESDFTRTDRQVYVYTIWQRSEDYKRGAITALVYDALGRAKLELPARKTTLPDSQFRDTFAFAPASLIPGVYRIDVRWNDTTVWRTFFRVVN
jgi:hypothetical protein